MVSYTVRYQRYDDDAETVDAWSPMLAAQWYVERHDTGRTEIVVVSTAGSPWSWQYAVRREVRLDPIDGVPRGPFKIRADGRREALDEIPRPLGWQHEAAILAALADGTLTWRALVAAAHLSPAQCSAAWKRLEGRGEVEVRNGRRGLADLSDDATPFAPIEPAPEPVAVELPPRRRERRSLSSLRRDGSPVPAYAYRVVRRLQQGPATGTELREMLGLSREAAIGVVTGLLREGWIRYRDGQYELAVEVVEEVTA